MLRTLGLEIGLARLKLVALELGRAGLRWAASVRAVPCVDGGDQGERLARGAALSVGGFLGELGWGRADLTVLASTASMAYPTLSASIAQARQLAAACGGDGGRLLGIDGSLLRPDDPVLDRPGAWWRCVATSPRASAHVGLRWLEARRGPEPSGWVVDCGSTSTEATRIAGGVIEAAAIADAEAFAWERLVGERLVWVGALATPVDTLLRYVTIRGRNLPVFPRMATTESAMTWLEGLDPGLVEAATGRAPLERRTAAHELAQAVGLDPEVLGEDGLEMIARATLDAARARIASVPWFREPGEKVWIGLGAIGGLGGGMVPGLDPRLTVLAAPLGLAWMGLEARCAEPVSWEVVSRASGGASDDQQREIVRRLA